MSIATIVLIICLSFIFFAIVYLLITRKSSSRTAFNHMDNVCQVLQQSGAEASPIYVEKDEIYLEKFGGKLRWGGSNHLGAVCDVAQRNFDYIFYTLVAREGQHDLHLEYVIAGKLQDSSYENKSRLGSLFYPKRVNLKVKKKLWLYGKIVDYKWKGDPTLIYELDSDSALRQALLRCLQQGKNLRKTFIYYTDSWGCAVVRVSKRVPSIEELEVINIIAMHVKSAWFEQ